MVVDDIKEIIWDTTRIRVLETPIDTRVINVLVIETSMQLDNLFRLKVIKKVVKALLARQVYNKMSEFSDSKLKYIIAMN